MSAPILRSLYNLFSSNCPIQKFETDAPIAKSRLQTVLANAGLGARRMMERRIECGNVRVNSRVAIIGSSVCAGDRIEIDSKLFLVVNDVSEATKILIYNKPEGVITSLKDPEGRPTVIEQLPELGGERWLPLGFLDIKSSGLTLLTTDRALANAITNPSAMIDREYICRVRGIVDDAQLKDLISGASLEGSPVHLRDIKVLNVNGAHTWLRMTLMSDQCRMVRRLLRDQGLIVGPVKRVRFGNIELRRGLLRGQSEMVDSETANSFRALLGAIDSKPKLTLLAA